MNNKIRPVKVLFCYELKSANFVKREEAKDDGADDAAIRNCAETVAGIPRVRAFAIIAGNEDFALRYGKIYFAGSVRFGAVGVRMTPEFIVDEAVRMFFIVNSHDTVFDGDTLAGEGNDTLNNVLIGYIRRNGAGGGVFHALFFVGFDSGFVFVHEDDNLTAFGDIFVTGEMGPRNGGTINNDTVIVMQSIFHADTNDVIGTINVGVEEKGT